MLRWLSAALMAGPADHSLPGNAKPGLLHMLKQPSRAATGTQDCAGRGTALAALRDASKYRAADVAVPEPHAEAAPPVGSIDAPASGAKAFLEAAKRTLDKAEYVQVCALQFRWHTSIRVQ
jgi:hypothetical protein